MAPKFFFERLQMCFCWYNRPGLFSHLLHTWELGDSYYGTGVFPPEHWHGTFENHPNGKGKSSSKPQLLSSSHWRCPKNHWFGDPWLQKEPPDQTIIRKSVSIRIDSYRYGCTRRRWTLVSINHCRFSTAFSCKDVTFWYFDSADLCVWSTWTQQSWL